MASGYLYSPVDQSTVWCLTISQLLHRPNLLLMEELLHQLIGTLSHHLQGFIHPRWCRISSINSMVRSTKNESWWNLVIRKKQQLSIRSGYEPYEKGIFGITLHPFFWKGFMFICIYISIKNIIILYIHIHTYMTPPKKIPQILGIWWAGWI